eukprot:s3466_g2.t1
MIQVHGYSPHQFVFGRGVNIPDDLLSEPLSVVPATASLTEENLAKSQAMRTTARIALARLQDDRSARVALLARPRKQFEFKPGDSVAYWRCQKWIQGKLQQGGRWYGPAVMIGTVGKNLILIHRRQLLRCAPEQVRPSTTEEKQLSTTPQAELLGIKNLIEQGGLQSKNYIDLVPEAYPPMQADSEASDVQMGLQMQSEQDQPDQFAPSIPSHSEPPPLNPSGVESVPAGTNEPESPNPDVVPASADADDKAAVPNDASVSAPSSSDVAPSDNRGNNYGPIRRRVTGKDGPMAFYRPPAMKQDDFVEVMKEVVPQLLEQVLTPGVESSASHKRPADDVERSPSEAAEPASSRARINEVLSVQDCSDLLALVDKVPSEVFMAEYLKKKMAKELPHSRNAPELQKLVDEGKLSEWQTLLSKPNAVRVHYGKAAERIKRDFAHRFIGSRFVLTRKPIEEGKEVDPLDCSTFLVKGRWCLQGHLDPDLNLKAESGLLKSPTLSQLGRMLLMQIIASQKWDLQLGDIKGAFLEAGPLDPKFKPLYAHQPPGGIPGMPRDAVIEVLGNVYGQNDAPAAWFKEFDTVVQSLGWSQSKLDPCLYTLREGSRLVGIMGVHVDDTALGGAGTLFTRSIEQLKSRFPYRKWRQREGEFCGAWYHQHDDNSIHMSMKSFAERIRPINVPKNSAPEDPLSDPQVRILRAVNGSLNWLSSQSRPDLSVQTSFSQQSFPRPTIQDFRKANQAVRRAKLESQLEIIFKPIDLELLTVVCHSDAAWANVGSHTQAGYVIAFTEKHLQDGQLSSWCPATWRSFRLSRAVSSTLAAEAQAMSIASSTVEWLLLLLSETIDGPLEIAKCRDVLQKRQPILDLLRKARAEGSLDMVVAEVLAEHGDEFELIPGGESMTDASKRRMLSPPESEAVVSGPDLSKGITGDSPVSFGTKMPAGIQDLDHWGKTLLLTGKYERSKMSYAEIVASERKEHVSYCAWMLAQRNRVDLTVQVKDFIRYLHVKSLSDSVAESCFEGSTVRRQMKA